MFEYLLKVYDAGAHLSLTLCLVVCTYKVEESLLDKVSMALKNCAQGLNFYILMKKNQLPAERKDVEKFDSL